MNGESKVRWSKLLQLHHSQSEAGQEGYHIQRQQLDGKLLTDWDEVWLLWEQMSQRVCGCSGPNGREKRSWQTRDGYKRGSVQLQSVMRVGLSVIQQTLDLFRDSTTTNLHFLRKGTLAGPGGPDNLSPLLHINRKRNRKNLPVCV